MNLNDIIKVHIWELPEKTNNIDKESEYTMIHDGFALKKVTMEKLYEYFNQDYKSENLIRYFDETLFSLDEEYQVKYSTLELSLSEYEKIVKELQEKFKVNRDNIRRLETLSIQLDRDIESLIIFESIENQYSILLYDITGFIFITNDIKNTVSDITNDINTLDEQTEVLNDSIIDLENSHSDMVNEVNNIKSKEESYLENTKETLIKTINDEYDKILAIVDYYHHIHDSSI